MASVFKVDDSEVSFIVADDEAQARAYYRENVNTDDPEDVTVTRLADDYVLTIHYEDHGPKEGPEHQTQTAAEWARERPSPCLLASSCW